MSSLEAKKITPATGTTGTLGAAGDTVTVPAGGIVKTNTVKDAGGNTLFTSDGSGTLSSVNSAFKGGLIYISSATPSGASSVEFTSGIDSTYNEYVFVFYGINPGTSGGNFQFQGSIDGGSNYNTTITSTWFRADHKQNDTAAGVQYETGSDLAQSTAYQILMGGLDVVSSDGRNGSGILHLFNPSSTTYVKQFYATCNYWDDVNRSCNSWIAGYMNTTSAVNAISFKFSSSYTTTGTIAMYGTG